MSYETKDNTGRLFKNDKKETEKHPHYTGSATIGGVEFFMDAWLNTAESGRKYMSFRFKPKQQRQAPPPTTAAPAAQYRAKRPDLAPTGKDFEDSVPF